MAKGKKNVLRTKDTVELQVTSRKEAKENTPETKANCEVQPLFQGVRHHSKPRSPLGDSSSMLIHVQEGNESDALNPDTSNLKKEIPNEIIPESCERREQKSEMACHSREKREQASDQLEQKEPTTRTNARPATENKVSASRTRGTTDQKPCAKKKGNTVSLNRKVTDYFPVRRSNRKTKSELKNEEYKHIDDVIKSGTEEGMQVKHIEGKGRGVFAVNGFKKGEFVVEYHGDLLELAEAKRREAQYAQDPQTGCYMYYFQYQSKTYCVDSTKETNRLGRLINHSKSGNCQTKLHPIDGTPHLILVASRDISPGEELLYDYGDRSKSSVLAHPWLKC